MYDKLKAKEYYLKNKVKILKQQKEYLLRLETKARRNEYFKRLEVKKRNRKSFLRYAKTKKGKKTISKAVKKYFKKRRRNDRNFLITGRLRCLLNQALKIYTQTGKIYNSKQYGIDYKTIIEHLKPFPKDIKLYHIDHIKPLCSFNLEDKEQIKLAFSPENHQWLLAKDNISKGGKINNGNCITN